jgi:glycosyltransferase involved in cell wall biosynthesis
VSSRPARVALFLPSLAGGGAERVFLDLARGLASRDRAVDLVLAKEEGELFEQIPDRVRVVPLGARRTATAVGGLAKYLARERPAATLSAIHHANMVAVAARVLARTGGRIVVTEHLPPSTWISTSPLPEARLMPRLLGIAYRHADAIVAVSLGVADDLAATAGIPRHMITVIHNPVIVERLEARAGEPLDDPWFRPGEPPVVLAVGRLTRQKDFATLIQAFAALRRCRSCRLVILGEGEERAALEALAVKLQVIDDVRLPGFATNPYPFFRRAAVVALSSRWEGLPTVLLEAICLHVPVVSTDCPSGPREILAGGRYGTLVPVGDTAALSGAMAAALDLPPKAPEPMIERYLLDHVVTRYERVMGLAPVGAGGAAGD